MITYAFYIIYQIECDDCSSMKVALNAGIPVFKLLLQSDVSTIVGIHIIDDGTPFMPIDQAGNAQVVQNNNDNNPAPFAPPLNDPLRNMAGLLQRFSKAPIPPPPQVADPHMASLQTLGFMQRTFPSGVVGGGMKTLKASDYASLLPKNRRLL